jgi:hypothetical protein
MKATLRVVTSPTGQQRVQCESCFIQSAHANGEQTQCRAAEGVWLAIGVSAPEEGIVPMDLCGQQPSHWVGQRICTQKELRLDFADRSSLTMPDLFAWRTRACSLSIHERHEEEAADASYMLVVSPYPAVATTDVDDLDTRRVYATASPCTTMT